MHQKAKSMTIFNFISIAVKRKQSVDADENDTGIRIAFPSTNSSLMICNDSERSTSSLVSTTKKRRLAVAEGHPLRYNLPSVK
jgi:hypothetical protein